LKFFPYFNDKQRQHHGFLFWTSFISLLGFMIVTLLFVLFQSSVVSYYSERSPLLVEYIFYLIPLGLATLFYTLFETYLRSLMKTIVSTLVNEIVLRLMVTLSISLYALKLVTFHEFVIIYVGVNCLAAVILLVYMAYLKQLLFKPEWSTTTKRFFHIILNFGFYSVLGNMSYILVSNIDSMMVASMVGLKETGVYTTIFFIATVMIIPYRSITRVASPLVAQFWKKRKLDEMHSLYKKVALLNIIIGCLLFLGIWVNMDNLFSFMPKEYAQGKYVFLFLGLGRLFDMATGINGFILVTSKKYRYDLFFALLLIGLTIGLNYFLIPLYGIIGASIATMCTLVIINLFRILFILFAFKMQPFDMRSVVVMLVGMAVYGIQYFIPPLFNVYADLILRSALCLVLFVIPIMLLKLSPETNEYIKKLLGYAGIKITL
ncbi:MAG TPA: polysaccharide biosynthesis C-terminal domain-containing protein, partial [Bacteroidia bacterium]